MSLLHKGTEAVTVYPQEVTTDSDGNTITRPSNVGIVARASVQPIGFTEDQTTGFTTESRYRLRLVGGPLLGPQSAVEWQGKWYAIEGEPRQYTGSPRTRHTSYVMVRA